MLVAMDIVPSEARSQNRCKTGFRGDMQDAQVTTEQCPVLQKGENQTVTLERSAILADDTLAYEDAAIRLAHVDERSVTADVTRRLHRFSRNPLLSRDP